jgi:hypothetical protein
MKTGALVFRRVVIVATLPAAAVHAERNNGSQDNGDRK